MLPEVPLLGNTFHELFRYSSDNLKAKSEWSRKKKRKWESFYKKKGKEASDMILGPPEVELPGNPSEFAVFAHVRQALLEAWTHKATQIYLNSSSSVPVLESTYEGDSESDVTEIFHPQPPRVPKIVGVGLRCVLEIIRDSRATHPGICTKALAALLDVLQGQQPQGLQNEPAEVIDPLFDLLLDLATCYGPESSAPDDGSHLTAIACSCLLSLVVVRGSTGKLLAATAALLMCPKQLANQNVHLPLVMTALQRSIYAVLLGKTSRPDWLTCGVPVQSKIDDFVIKNSGLGVVRSLASDGQFLYLYSSRGLFKIGSGHGGTIRGHIYYCVPDFFHDEKGWLGFANGWLWLKVSGKKGCELLQIDRDPFRVVDTIRLDTRDWTPGVWFSDSEQLGIISSVCDDGFVVKTLNPHVKPHTITSELSLKLARKCIDVMGVSSFDEESGNKTLNTDFDDEILSIVAGKEFGLVRTSSGKVYYSGKASSVGMKSGSSSGRWSELTIPKSSRAQHVAMGHEGLHAVIVTEDGGVYFCGTARRGEDGDLSKARRQPKAVKPKKMVKVEEEFIIHAAANNGTTALVTRNGQLLMFGKDTVHCNSSTGQVIGMKNLQVTQVALGKAHAVALTSKGIVYTFGINNKGQCGRDFTPQVREVIAMETTTREDDKEDEFDAEDAQDAMCPSGKHQWRQDVCMVCTICKECTGYNVSCLSSMRPHRNPGQECGCGEGDSGCAVCGCCRVCAKENVDNVDAALDPSGAGDSAGMARLDLKFIGDNQAVRHTNRLQEHLQRRLEERKQRQSRKNSSKHYCGLKMKNSCSRSGSNPPRSGSSIPIYKAPAPIKFSSLINEEQPGGSDAEKDPARVTSLPPAPIALPYTCPVVQISCGLHHTIVLTQAGEVFTFGSNIYGQLGIGDVLLRGGPVNVRLPNLAQSVAAGSNHTVILTVKGEVYTFGSYQKGQLGRKCLKSTNDPSTSGSGRRGNYSNQEGPWYAIPGPVPGIGPHSGRRATWIGAAGDQTFIKVDESLINSLSLEQATITGNKTCILLVPRAESNIFRSLAISRRDGGCAIFSGPGQVHLAGSPICLDPLYNVLWSFHQNTNSISCHNIIASEARGLEALSHSMFDPDLILPISSGCLVRRSQAALHLLGALDTLAQAQYFKLEVGPEVFEKQPGPTKAYTLQDYSTVNRFESHGGGWGYSGHSVEAVRFMADADIILGGFGLFGGRGEYTAKIKLLDIGMEGGEQEADGEVIAETEDVPYECGPRQKYSMLFEEPVLLHANRWYVAWARISGPSSDCGSNGQAMITTEDQISFYFKSSKKSNNGTDVNAGQIPQLLYKVVTQEIKAPPRQPDQSEPVFVLSKEFSSTVSRECFQSLLSLLHWGWNSLKSGYSDCNGSISAMSSHAEHQRMARLVYINRASLRLIHHYTNEIYPDQIFGKKVLSESVRLAECIGDVRALLRQILSDKLTRGTPRDLMEDVLEECHKTFVLVFHALYPTPFLKWTCLCDLLAKMDPSELHYTQHDRLLSAVLEALCSPTIRLRSALPVLTDNLDPTMRQLSPSDNSGLTVSGTDHYYPLLVEQMSYRTQLERNGEPIINWGWKEVLDKLLDLAVLPVKRDLAQRNSKISKDLVQNCCSFLGRVIGELAFQSSGSDEDLQGSCGRVLHVTPSRFMRTNQTRTWNTGNGSPDAICFSVDKPGVVVAGVCVYGGVGTLEYELELLDDSNTGVGDPSPAQRWTSLEVVKGTFGPDDCISDVAELKFNRPVPIKENIKYAIRLRNQGGRTSNGDGGLSSVRGPDGVTFSFSTCSLSFNGTTQTRGQIPQILYYSNPQDGNLQHTTKAVAEHQARKSTLAMTTAVVNRCCSLLSLAREKAEDMNVNEILGNACVINTLLPLVCAHIGTLGTSDPRSAVQIINLIQELLPHVSALNLIEISNNEEEVPKQTTSNHYAWVESDHPYKQASVSNYRVSFPESVKWMVIEFSPGCGTVQVEDSLKLYIPSVSKDTWERNFEEEETDSPAPVPYWRVLRTLRGGIMWPENAVVLPGNEVIFSLETASDYLKNEKACNYGFRCLVIGYEWNPLPNKGLRHLESELAFLAGMCAASLLKKDLHLPPITVDEAEDDVELAEEAAMTVANEHCSLLVRGLALAQIPTITQALDGILPFSCQSNERLFLKDFVQCSPSSSGGRLARWLQPDSYADPSKCEVLYSREDLRCGWPAIVTILTKDQYGEIVHVPNLKVEVKAVPIDKKGEDSDCSRKMKRLSEIEPALQPPFDVPYEVTIEDKLCYHAITVMKAFENFSFEELRYYYPAVKRTSENMLVRPYNDGTYGATWTPSNVGWYSILVTIDGYSLEEAYKVEVKEPPQGVAPPPQSAVKKSAHQPSRLRKFVLSNSAGLRVRAHPSLQSEQIGVVHVNGTIAFIDEIHNDDGVWLRLNHETMKQYCPGSINGINEAWCLQYNQHLGKTLLLPVEEPKRILNQVIKEAKKLPELTQKEKVTKPPLPGIYTVVKCGAACHNVRSRPSLQAPAVGMMVLGNQIEVTDQVVNSEGTWVKLNPEFASKYFFNHVTEAWSLARSPNNELYLRPEINPGESENKLETNSATSSPKKGYDFTTNASGGPFGNSETSGFSFTPPRMTPPQANYSPADPFVFGDMKSEKKGPYKSPKDDLKGNKERYHISKDAPLELFGAKALGECRVNGNSETPPGTPPRRASRSSSPKAMCVSLGRSSSPRPQIMSSASSSPNIPLGGETDKTSRSSSPVPIPGWRKRSPVTSPPDPGPSTPTSLGYSPLVSGGAIFDSQYSIASQRRGSTQSDTSALVSSLTRDLSQSPLTKDLSPSASSSSLPVRDGSPFRKESYYDDLSGRKEYNSQGSPRKDAYSSTTDSPKAMMQIGTQTSPEGGGSMKGHFNIGSAGKEEKVSPKLIRKERGLSKASKRLMSPASQIPSTSTDRCFNIIKEPVKEAMSPSVAESLRAVFAAFLWQEGIVHDAMACASFLKFNPSLPKQGVPVVTRRIASPVNAARQELTKEQKQFQRHSVEVSTSGNYLHIQPATLESLTRSAANANANRTRKKQQSPQEASIKEEVPAEIIKPKKNLNKSKKPESSVVSVLPPALKGLVIIWEELSSTIVRAFEQHALFPSPSLPSRLSKNAALNREKVLPRKHPDLSKSKSEGKRSSRKKKEWKPMGKLNALGEVSELVAPLLNAGNERETACEMCGGVFPHPVTYHMRQAHPGCGGLAGGKGYNSSGNFCVGWAGHCGDGGVGGSSWYLICDACREKYIRLKKDRSGKERKKSNGKKKAAISTPIAGALPLTSPVFAHYNFSDAHNIMKDNAMFLLDLASSSNVVVSNQQRRSIIGMPSLSEHHSPPDPSGPFSPVASFQCLAALGSHLREQELQEMLQRQPPQEMDASYNGNPHPNSSFEISDGEDQKGRLFHRSVSMGTSGMPWAKKDNEGRIMLSRKRNNSSSGEVMSEAGSSLLCRPSATLQKLIPGLDESAIMSSEDRLSLDLLRRPSVSFILRRHPLYALRFSMKHSLRKATCRLYAFQALNWLLRNVTQPVCLHDLLWWFVASLSQPTNPMEVEPVEEQVKKEDIEAYKAADHPLNDITFAGDAAIPLWKAFHQFLQTVADLMMLLSPSCSLQTMAVRCWGLKFSTIDHAFLHRSQVFSNISKILSRSEEESDDVSIFMSESHQSASSQQIGSLVEALKDLTADIEIKVSSRQAMVGSLTDSSTETFWESGDEDRNKTKTMTINCPPNCIPKMIYIHIDNCRDLANKVASVTFYSGPTCEELSKIRQVDVESRSTGWISSPVLGMWGDSRVNKIIRTCQVLSQIMSQLWGGARAIQIIFTLMRNIDEVDFQGHKVKFDDKMLEVKIRKQAENIHHSVIRLEFKGPDNSLRVRQIRILGETGDSLAIAQRSAATIQQRLCETETLKVFRLITSQVFGKLIRGENEELAELEGEQAEDTNDLKEHMVGILFSRSKLTHLQKQVCMHIVHALRKETVRVREEWECLLCSPVPSETKPSDTYAFEMLSMVLALSGSSVGRVYLSHQYGLLTDLLSLLHTGSARVQRQVTALLRRVLPEVTPSTFANVLGVEQLPPSDFSVASTGSKQGAFDVHKCGILDVFLSVVAKALTVQVKVKGRDAKGVTTVSLATAIHPRDPMKLRWWLRGCISRKLAEDIIQLLNDMSAGKLSESWANVTKGAIAENIINLTRLDESQRGPAECLKTPTLWLALASLCVLDTDHVERLSSGQWSRSDGQPLPPRPTCTNHDDNVTGAIIQCSVCGNLCADCDRYLHLHRRTRMHQRQVCKEEEEAIKVDLHEGCGRTKLFWVLALADSCTLKAMVEFREGTKSKATGTGVCRFCGATGNSGLLAIGNVCTDQECQEHAKNVCNKVHSCGHVCGGLAGEVVCLPCLQNCKSNPSLKQDADDMCMICFTEALSCAPAIQLHCGHVFHAHCARDALSRRWAGPRITFSFSQCPICKAPMKHSVLSELLKPIEELYEDVKRKALMRLEYEGLHRALAITSPGAKFHNDPASYAMDRYAYYVCYKCKKAYYGGEARCDIDMNGDFDPSELVCGGCSDVARAQMCPKHGTDFLEYKCRYCCSVAVFFCFGTTHFCNSCHDDFQRVTNIPKPELPKCPAGPKAKQLDGEECPLHVSHPPTGEEFALGCGVCRNAHTF